MASEVRGLSIPESICENLLFKAVTTHTWLASIPRLTLPRSAQCQCCGPSSPDPLLPYHIILTMIPVSSLVSLLLLSSTVCSSHIEGACELLSQTRPLLTQNPSLIPTSLCHWSNHSSVPCTFSAPSHLRVFTHAVPSTWSTLFPSSVNSYSSSLCSGSISNRKSSRTSLMGCVPQYRISQLLDLLLHGLHLIGPSHLFS